LIRADFEDERMISPSQPLRVELTVLDRKLHRKELKFFSSPVPHLLYSTPYKDAVSPPFPARGKAGIAVFVGRREQFRQPEVPLLWELEKNRGRARIAVLTSLRGKEFGPAFRELESSLAEPHLAPVSFLRRRGKQWDSLDFFSNGSSPSMEGAAPRLQRLKQRGWEAVVDRLSQVDSTIRELYFEELHVDRPQLQSALTKNFVAGNVCAMVGIAGQCLQKEHFPLFFREEMNKRLLMAYYESFNPPAEPNCWIFLGKRDSAKELLLLTEGEKWLEKGDVLVGDKLAEARTSELIVEDVLQRLQLTVGSTTHTVIRVQVEWRYRPAREIPVYWKQNSTFAAGATAPNG
jgi:hypothetical protein